MCVCVCACLIFWLENKTNIYKNWILIFVFVSLTSKMFWLTDCSAAFSLSHWLNVWLGLHDGSQPYVQILHRLGDVELVHSGDDDGWGGEEEEQEEEDAVDDEAAKPPGDSSQRQMLPVSQTEFTSACSVQQNITQQKEWNLLAW